MLTQFRLVLLSVLIASTLIACGESADSSHSMPIATGTSEQATIDKLGTPNVSQSRTIDALTFTQSEWTTETGMTSVQFHNGKVTFSQFSPTVSED